jgi:hypothetical protein
MKIGKKCTKLTSHYVNNLWKNLKNIEKFSKKLLKLSTNEFERVKRKKKIQNIEILNIKFLSLERKYKFHFLFFFLFIKFY